MYTFGENNFFTEIINGKQDTVCRLSKVKYLLSLKQKKKFLQQPYLFPFCGCDSNKYLLKFSLIRVVIKGL